MSLLKLIIIYSLSCFYTTLVLLRTLFKIIVNGRSHLQRKERSLPSCLSNPDCGHHEYIKLKDVKLHYVEAGDKSKPLVVFLHGFPEFWYSWRHQIKALKKDFWTVAVDMRGYSESDKPSGVSSYKTKNLTGDIEELVQALGRSSCILVAHDWGGVIAWYLAAKSPKLIEKLIILNAPHPSAFSKLIQSSWKQFLSSWYIFFVQMPFIPEFILSLNDYELFDRGFLSHPKGQEAFSPQDIDAFKYTFAKSGFNGPLNYYRNLKIALSENADDLPKIKMPVLVIWGKDDIALVSQLATLSSDYCENCTVKYVDGASHWVQQDSPKVVNNHITQFIKSKA